MIRKIVAISFSMVFVAACRTGQSGCRCDSVSPADADMKLMSYNVLHCAGIDKKIDIARTAEVIKRENPRFVGLQELDCKAAKRSGGVDQPAELGRLTGMHATFAQALPFQGGGYGVAVLSREKPLSVFKAPLPGKEPRVLLLCEFNDCWFGTTHLALQETNRLAAVEIIRKAVTERAAAKPVYLTGDWNATPCSKSLAAMRSFMAILSDTTGRTYHGFKKHDPADAFCIDYIAVDSFSAKKLVVRDSHVVPDVTTSDHSPVVATVSPAGNPSASSALGTTAQDAVGCQKAECPIGVFDSGVGGLTVLEKLLSVDVVDNETGRPGADGVPDLQGERFTFLGDQANMPYGNYADHGKNAFLRELAIRNALFLTSDGYYRDAEEEFPGGMKKPAKIVVIACNTATAYGLKAIESSFLNAGARIRVVGVVNAGCRSALDQLGAGPDSEPFAVGILSTVGTCMSEAYPRTLREEAAKRGMRNPPVAVALGCPHLADSIELGLPKAGALARRYLADLVEAHRASGSTAPLRALILGCTHFPFVLRHFEEELSALRKDPKYAPLLAPDFRFIDPAVDTAVECRRLLAGDGLLAKRSGTSSVAAYVSVPNASLPPEKVQANGTLADAYKYGRDPGRDIVDSKCVPIAKGTVDRDTLYRLVEMLPAVKLHLAR